MVAAPKPELSADPLGLLARSHPLRAVLSQEMHLRRLPRLGAPARLLQIVVLIDETARAATTRLVASLREAGEPPLPEDARHALFRLGGLRGVWERHAEFATFGLILEGAFDDPFDPAAFAGARPLVEQLPGPVIRATLIALAPATEGARLAPLAQARFEPGGLVTCGVANGRARIWSDFRLDEDGLGRLLIADAGLVGDEPAQVVQRLQELGNYRNMALLGLPVAQQLTPELGRLEQRLATLTARVADPARQDEPLLEELTGLSAELARLMAETRYRMGATEAYAKIVEERLAWLAVTPLPGHQTLTDFTDRRLMPAVRTCATVSRRLDELSQRAAWTSSLLRTRIDTGLARQNRDLLHSMDSRTRLQLRLQQAVEGLSVVAISYYLVALLGEMVRPIARVPHDVVVAIAAPIVVFAAAWHLRRLKRRLRE